MELSERLLREELKKTKDQLAQSKPPSGWEPGVQLDGNTGSITSRPTDQKLPDWRSLLLSWGFDPELYEVLDPVQIRTWDAFSKGENGIETKQLWYHRANIRRRTSADADAQALLTKIGKRRPLKIDPSVSTSSYFVVPLADLQIGKGEGGGTPATIVRTESVIDQAVTRFKELRKLGRKVDKVAILNAGDSIENACGWYSEQAFTVDLNRRDQVRIARRLFDSAIEAFTPLASEVIVSTCDSNHGENRVGNKSGTDQRDNAELEIFESLQEAYAKNPSRYDHIKFVLPDDASVTMLDLGIPIALAHGHRAPSGSSAAVKQTNWWKGQSLGGHPAGDARLLLTGHYHHAALQVDYGRTWIQLPSLDGGSKWLTDKTGQHSPPGLLTFVTDPGSPLGWCDLEILNP